MLAGLLPRIVRPLQVAPEAEEAEEALTLVSAGAWTDPLAKLLLTPPLPQRLLWTCLEMRMRT
jgi:hypothetical protein